MLGRGERLLTVGSAVVVLVALFLPWVEARTPGGVKTASGAGLPYVGWVGVLLVLWLIAASLVARFRDHAAWSLAAAGTATCMLTFTAIVLVVVTGSSELVPRGFLPGALKDHAPDLAVLPGLWVFFAALLVCSLAAVLASSGFALHHQGEPRAVLACAAAACAALSLYLPWVQAGVVAGGIEAAPTEFPFIGWIAVIVSIMLVGAAAWLVIRPVPASLIAAALGAVIAAFAGFFVIVVFAASATIPDTMLPKRFSSADPSVELAAGAWLALIAGMATTVLAVFKSIRERSASRTPVPSAEAADGQHAEDPWEDW